jgi:endonuclease YncB( thermonuclease family)
LSADRIGERTVACGPRDTDRYGRIVAICRVGGEDLNAWLVSQGLALAYRHYSTAYVGQGDAAHAAHRGVWRGEFTAPWEWRRGVRTPTFSVGEDEPTLARYLLQGLRNWQGLREQLR